MNNILADNYILDDFNPKALAQNIANNFKTRRIEENITQTQLANQSSVSLGSIKRFESKAEISLKNILLLAVALNATHEFKELFSKQQYSSIDELTQIKEKKTRKRARKND
ncbi:MAG: helix-turn-helix transcriptional regulator [Salinivirgaceae bacterium]|nr:helix-turn-helix transcriptional regulator [Salinivirgaceae bacterium]